MVPSPSWLVGWLVLAVLLLVRFIFVAFVFANAYFFARSSSVSICTLDFFRQSNRHASSAQLKLNELNSLLLFLDSFPDKLD